MDRSQSGKRLFSQTSDSNQEELTPSAKRILLEEILAAKLMSVAIPLLNAGSNGANYSTSSSTSTSSRSGNGVRNR
jgi:hypothetical protein